MADGNVTNKQGQSALTTAVHVHGATLMFDQDYIVDVDLDHDEVEAEVLEVVAARLVNWATATIHIARLRGENDCDLPGTMDGALGAAEICMQLARGFTAAAAEMRKEKENDNG